MEWVENVKSVIAGYESVVNLSEREKYAVPYVMESIEILFVAYFIGIKDTKHANDAYNVFHFIQNCESDIKNAIGQNSLSFVVKENLFYIRFW